MDQECDNAGIGPASSGGSGLSVDRRFGVAMELLPIALVLTGPGGIIEVVNREAEIMFGYARTVAMGFLETGCVRRGADLGVGVNSDGRPRPLQTILVFNRDLEEITAGRDPFVVGLGWLGHLNIEAGSVLTPRNVVR